MLVKEQYKRVDSTELKDMLEKIEKMNDIAKISFKVNLNKLFLRGIYKINM
jgi:hypothetical protein